MPWFVWRTFQSYGTQQPIALLKLLFEKGGMFDCDRDLKWKIFKDVGYFCAMTTPGGDRNELDARFVSLCATLNINRLTDAIAFSIYKSILRGHLADFSPDLHPISDTLIKMTLRLFKVSAIHTRRFDVTLISLELIEIPTRNAKIDKTEIEFYIRFCFFLTNAFVFFFLYATSIMGFHMRVPPILTPTLNDITLEIDWHFSASANTKQVSLHI